MKKINKNISGIICVISLIYFTGISMYTLVPEIKWIGDIDIKIWHVLYWVNNTVFLFSFTFILSYLIYDILTKIIVRGTSVFLLILGVFQIIKTLGYSVDSWAWMVLCPLYIVFLLTGYVYVSKKLF